MSTNLLHLGALVDDGRKQRSIPINEIETVKARLLSKSFRAESGCLEWTGYIGKRGYGVMSVHNYPRTVHRLSWMVHKGNIPDDLFVLHKCDNQPCFEPEHLFLGTNLDNIADMHAKGRGSPPPKLIGLENPKATLTEEEVGEIVALMSAGATQREVARRFNCSNSTAWRIGNLLIPSHHHRRS